MKISNGFKIKKNCFDSMLILTYQVAKKKILACKEHLASYQCTIQCMDWDWSEDFLIVFFFK